MNNENGNRMKDEQHKSKPSSFFQKVAAYIPLSNTQMLQKGNTKNDNIKVMRLLFLGSGESGKSTIIKQMKILHGEVCSIEDRVKINEVIADTIRNEFIEVINKMMSDESFDDVRSTQFSQYISQDNTFNDNYETFYEAIQVLWHDTGFQRTYHKIHRCQLNNSITYFLNKLDSIKNRDYIPTDQDYLMCNVRTKDICETKLLADNTMFHILDVGGRRDFRKHWIKCFNDITAIIFVVNCSEFNLTLAENATENRLQESLNLFQSICNNRWLTVTPIIIFFNQQDLLEQKIASGLWKIEEYFPDYSCYVPNNTYSLPTCERVDSKCKEAVVKAKCFIRDQFLNIITESHIKTYGRLSMPCINTNVSPSDSVNASITSYSSRYASFTSQLSRHKISQPISPVNSNSRKWYYYFSTAVNKEPLVNVANYINEAVKNINVSQTKLL